MRGLSGIIFSSQHYPPKIFLQAIVGIFCNIFYINLLYMYNFTI